MQPTTESSIISEPTVNTVVENTSPVIENGPTIEEQPPINIEPQVVIQDNNIAEKDMSVEEIRNKINALCDLLIEKEKMIDAKLQVANIAYNNAQNINQMSNEETINIADYQSNDQSKTLSA